MMEGAKYISVGREFQAEENSQCKGAVLGMFKEAYVAGSGGGGQGEGRRQDQRGDRDQSKRSMSFNNIY